jgi:hypothetical protein
MGSRKKWSLLGTALVGVLSLLLIALPGAAAARQHHKGHSHHKKHHKRHHQRHRHHRSGTQTGGGTSTSGEGDIAGTIASFDGTTLTITLLDESSVSGTVDASTEIQCEANDNNDDGDTGDDNSGDDDTGDDNSGDDDGGSAGSGDARVASASSMSDDGDTGDDDGTDDDSSGDDGGEQCSTADLVPGTVVSEAELDSTGTFTEIELVK